MAVSLAFSSFPRFASFACKAAESTWEMEGAFFNGSPLVDICNGNDNLRPSKKESKVFYTINAPQTAFDIRDTGMAALAHHHQQQQQARRVCYFRYSQP
jgi:hypothetical protein